MFDDYPWPSCFCQLRRGYSFEGHGPYVLEVYKRKRNTAKVLFLMFFDGHYINGTVLLQVAEEMNRGLNGVFAEIAAQHPQHTALIS